jgi:hypothetical protein
MVASGEVQNSLFQVGTKSLRRAPVGKSSHDFYERVLSNVLSGLFVAGQ